MRANSLELEKSHQYQNVVSAMLRIWFNEIIANNKMYLWYGCVKQKPQKLWHSIGLNTQICHSISCNMHVFNAYLAIR